MWVHFLQNKFFIIHSNNKYIFKIDKQLFVLGVFTIFNKKYHLLDNISTLKHFIMCMYLKHVFQPSRRFLRMRNWLFLELIEKLLYKSKPEKILTSRKIIKFCMKVHIIIFWLIFSNLEFWYSYSGISNEK